MTKEPAKKKNTVTVCEELALPIADELGVYIWDTVFEKEGAGWYLRYLIDTDEGVDIDTCETFSRRMSDLLDAADPIDQSYCLEVSSPGIERKFTRPWHYERYMGETVLVRLIRPVEGVREFIGTLESVDEAGITIALDDEQQMTFTQDETAYVRLYVEF